MKGTHSDHNELPEPVGTDKAGKKNRPLDKSVGDNEFDTAATPSTEIMPFGKVAEEIIQSLETFSEMSLADQDSFVDSLEESEALALEMVLIDATALSEGAVGKVASTLKRGVTGAAKLVGRTALGGAKDAAKVVGRGAAIAGGMAAGGALGGAHGATAGAVGGAVAYQAAAEALKRRRDRKAGKVVAKEDLDILFAGSGVTLTEEFTSKAFTLFEGAVSAKVESIRASLNEEAEARIEQEVADHSTFMEERLDTYLDLFVEEFMTKNEIAITNGIKQEFAEQIAESVSGILESYSIDLSDEKVDVAESLTAELLSKEAELNESIETIAQLKNGIKKYEIKEAFANATADLTDVDREKLQKLSENISFESVQDYVGKVNTLKEGLSSVSEAADTNGVDRQVTLTEQNDAPALPAWKQNLLKAARGEI